MACMWDYDTIEMEFEQFPGTLEIISGHFLRHSPEFYYWRIKDREQKLQSADSLKWHDDIAVAYSKLGNDPKAIAITQPVLERFPERYESLANLGTFYIHNGQYQEGLAFLEEAVKINPDAHFGRERYQIALVEYLIEINWKNQKKLPLQTDWNRLPYDLSAHNFPDLAQYDRRIKARVLSNPEFYEKAESPSFYEFLLAQYRQEVDSTEAKLPIEELENAIQGISGMIKFGNHNSPVLMDALGELLVYNYDLEYSNRHLGIVAFLRAAELSKDPQIKEVYDQKVYQIMDGKGGYNDSPLKIYRDLLAREVKAADDNYNKIRQDEIAWILAGEDPEKAFAAKYYRASKVKRVDWNYALGKKRKDKAWQRAFEKLKRDDLKRVEWKSHKSTPSIDSLVQVYVDEILLKIESKEAEMKPQTSNSNNLWFALLIGLAILGGGFYAYKNRT